MVGFASSECIPPFSRRLRLTLVDLVAFLRGTVSNGAVKACSLGGFGLLLAAKPIVDMFWSAQYLDYALLAYVVALLAFGLFQREVSFGVVDVFAICLCMLLCLSALAAPGGAVVCIKMLSPFAVYFVGRLYWDCFESAKAIFLVALAVVVAVNVACIAVGQGYQLWGSARTFTGVFFFKTDLACALATAFFAWLFIADRRRVTFAICAASALLVVLSNTRAYYVILLVGLLLYVSMRVGFRISPKMMVIAGLGMLIALYFLNWLFSTGVFSGLNFISFRFDSLSDLMDSSNTQGRNVIWSYLLDRINGATLPQRLFGIDLLSDQVFVNGASYGSHSLYVGLLYNVGLVGLALFVSFVSASFLCVCRLEDRRFGYFVIVLLMQLLVGGISVHVLQYTANSWICFAVLGVAVSASRANSSHVFGDVSAAIEVRGGTESGKTAE